MAQQKYSKEEMKAAAKERLSGPLPISVVIDKNGRIKHGTRADLDRIAKNQTALAALEAGDDATYDKIMKEIYGG